MCRSRRKPALLGEAGFRIGRGDRGDEPERRFLECGADAELERFLALGAEVHVEQFGAEEAENVEPELVAGELLGQADGPDDEERARVNDAKIDRDALSVGPRLGTDLAYPRLDTARADVVVELSDPADDVIIRRRDAAPEIG